MQERDILETASNSSSERSSACLFNLLFTRQPPTSSPARNCDPDGLAMNVNEIRLMVNW
jgi:hypothetical protein